MQQEMQQEREKYNQLLLKFQDLQSQVIEDSHVSEIPDEINTKKLISKFNVTKN